MNHITVVFPHQLFESHPALDRSRRVFLVEEPHFFTRYRFHKQKVQFHRASLREYQAFLSQKGYDVIYVSFEESLYELLKKDQIAIVHCAYLFDHVLEKLFRESCEKEGIEIRFYESPYFLTTMQRFKEHFSSQKSFYFTTFYKEQRCFFNVLMSQGKPQGGKFSFDPENRKKLPASHAVPPIEFPQPRQSVNEAYEWMKRFFKDNPGTDEKVLYPVTFADAKKWLDSFLKQRLDNFGTYEDALSLEHDILYHSVLSPLLNVGLLTPDYVLTTTLAYAESHKVPLNSLEGFVRQIIGWREFVCGVYLYQGTLQEQSNYFNHTHKLPYSFWLGQTGVDPLDRTIARVHKSAYAHHIERLMLFGNFMLLSGINPKDVYLWFMELFIDAYDWVMIPNIFGMSQYADGGLMVTKPYISGANYLKTMSTYPSGSWEPVFTHLYWNFLSKKYDKLSRIPRMNLVLRHMTAMNSQVLQYHTKQAELFLVKFLQE